MDNNIDSTLFIRFFANYYVLFDFIKRAPIFISLVAGTTMLILVQRFSKRGIELNAKQKNIRIILSVIIFILLIGGFIAIAISNKH